MWALPWPRPSSTSFSPTRYVTRHAYHLSPPSIPELQALQISQLLRDYTSAVVNSTATSRLANGGGGGIGHTGANSASRRKSVEFDLALRNMSTADKNNKSNFGSMPVPQPRRSLMSAAYDTQFYMQQQQQQLYQNHAQMQFQILQQQQLQQLQQRRPRPLVRHPETDHV